MAPIPLIQINDFRKIDFYINFFDENIDDTNRHIDLFQAKKNKHCTHGSLFA
jgi:hypothetical protein